MTTLTERSSTAPEAAQPHKRMMSHKQILLMNAGLLGILHSFGMRQTAANPTFADIGADPHSGCSYAKTAVAAKARQRLHSTCCVPKGSRNIVPATSL